MSARQDSWKAQGRIGWLRPPLSLAPLALAFVLILAGADGLAAPAEADERARGLHQIEHVIVLMQENRSFDHYFGELHFQGQPAAEPRPADASNPDPTNPTGPPIEAFHQSRYCDVAGIDYEPSLVERARERARAEGSVIDFREADAQALPFEDGAFDVVLSVFGVMFAPDQEKAARELVRVCRPGGKIGLASWMPTEFGGDLFRAHAGLVPPPAGLKPGVRWGTEEGLRELLGDQVTLTLERATFTQYFHSIDHALEIFRTYFGPSVRAAAAVGVETWDKAIGEVFRKYDRGTGGTTALECGYLRAIAVKK